MKDEEMKDEEMQDVEMKDEEMKDEKIDFKLFWGFALRLTDKWTNGRTNRQTFVIVELLL